MRFIYLTLSAFAALAAAATNGANPFNIPKDGYSFNAGEPTTLSWAPTTDGTVSLRLQWGAVLDPQGGTTIASSISNSGSFTWTPPSSLAAQPDYTIEIIDDSDSSEVNYLPRFTVNGATGAAITATASKTTSSAEPTTSAEKSTTEEKTTSTPSTKTHTTLSSMTSPSSSASATTTSGESSSASNTASATTSGDASSTSASAAETTVPNTNAGMANRVSGGMLAVILGAAALL